MNKKALISILILLFIASFLTCTVTSASESKTLQDSQGDVVDENGNVVTGKDEYDIDKIIYTNDNGAVTFEIKLHGIITESPNITVIIGFVTSEMSIYQIASEGGDAYGLAGENFEQINVTFEGFGTSSLIYYFNLLDENEEYFYMMLQLGEISEADPNSFKYSDQYPNEGTEMLEVEIQAPETAKVGDSVQFSSNIVNGIPDYTYKWDFDMDEKTDSELKNPTYKFTEPGIYDVTLIVTDDTGNIGLNSTSINITSESSNGEQNNENDQGSGLTLFIVLIVILIVIGIAVVVYLIRR